MSPLLVSYTVEILPFNIRARGLMIMNLAVNCSLIFNQYVNPIALEVSTVTPISPQTTSVLTPPLFFIHNRRSAGSTSSFTLCGSLSNSSSAISISWRPSSDLSKRFQPYLTVKTPSTSFESLVVTMYSVRTRSFTSRPWTRRRTVLRSNTWKGTM